MSIRILSFLALILLLLTGCKNKKSPLADLPDIYSGKFKNEPYLETAIQLQTLGETAAVARLRSLAATKESEDSVIVLCRMLFTSRPLADFRRPFIGGASFLGDTDYADWPLEPIEMVDGIPFLVTQDYIVGGFPESAQDYLDYCVSQAQWNPLVYRRQSEAEKAAALAKLIASPKWKRPLVAEEQDFFAQQIR